MEEIETNINKKTFGDIVLEQFQNVIKNANVEFRGGFYLKIISLTGVESRQYVPDTREIFCNSVYCFAQILKPKLSPTLRPKYLKFAQKLSQIKKEFIESSDMQETIILGDSFYKGQDKIRLEEYKNKKLSLHWRLFQLICQELAYKKYFTMGEGIF